MPPKKKKKFVKRYVTKPGKEKKVPEEEQESLAKDLAEVKSIVKGVFSRFF